VILSKNEDFAVRCENTAAGPVIVCLRIGNASNQALRVWLEPRMAGIIQRVGQGSRLIEVI
jgi:predicted nuclease of predicted toxin-antitoxin system